MDKERFLPLGTIVRTKGNIKKVMIIGRCLYLQEKDSPEKTYYDYSAVLYPEGMTGDSFVYIMNKDVDEIVYRGYADEENTRMLEIINEALAVEAKDE